MGHLDRCSRRPHPRVTDAPIGASVVRSEDFDHDIRCWGADHFGQASPPERVRFSSIAAGGRHTCGVRTDGAIECWGIPAFIAY